MSRLIQLREQIRAIQTTKKITHAVRLVSMSMYGKLEKLSLPHKTYFQSIAKFFMGLIEQAPEWQHPVFTPQDLLDERPLFIVIATSKGLCGSLNTNLFRMLEQYFSLQKFQQAEFIVLGRRGIRFVKDQVWGEVVHAYAEINSHNYTTVAEDIVDRIVNSNKNYTSITFFGSQLTSFFHQQPKKLVMLPFDKNELDLFFEEKNLGLEVSTNNFFETEPIVEQPLNELLEYAATAYIQAFVLNTLFQTVLAEHAARFLAMDSSTTNAEHYLERLTLQYNKIRQASITREVAELSSNSLAD